MTVWYLRKSDGQIYGPAALADLQAWAADGRIEPGDSVSTDQARWIAPEQIPDLQLEYEALLDQGNAYGPLHLQALRTLVQEESIDPATPVRHTTDGITRPLAEWLLPSLLQQVDQREARAQASQQDMERLQETAPGDRPAPESSVAQGVDEAEWSTRLNAAEEQRAALEERCTQLEAQSQAEREKRQALEEQLAAQPTEAATASTTDWQERCDRLEAESQEYAAKEKAWTREHNVLLEQVQAAERAREALQTRMEELQIELETKAAPEASDDTLRQAHEQLMENYDLLSSQLDEKTKELDTLRGNAPGGQVFLNNQVAELRGQLESVTKALEKERQQRETVERKHLQLIKSYRDLNDRYIQLRQGVPATAAATRPANAPIAKATASNGTPPPATDNPPSGTKPKLRLT